MSNPLGERVLEEEIEASLLAKGGYSQGNPKNYDVALGFDKITLLEFIKTSQLKMWSRLEGKFGERTEDEFVRQLVKELNNRSIAEVLRNELGVYGCKFRLCFFKPETSMNSISESNYESNILSVYRQVHYSSKNNNSVDIVLGVNGLPVVTMELKNALSGQKASNAIRQYREDRDPRELLLAPFKRSIVHFAVDTDWVFMTTMLKGKQTDFLPFNKGTETNGAGNPSNPDGRRTSYLWEDVLTADSLLEIIEKFVKVVRDEEGSKVGVIFPRYHQLDCVRKAVADAKINGSGQNYLIQHSAGSGKSNSIAWLAHQLSSLHDGLNRNVFSAVIVVTDRRVLDQQLRDTVNQFETVKGVVVPVVKGSGELKDAINSGAKVIISTLQKFEYIFDQTKVQGKTFAVIIDEAHSSQTGKAHAKLKESLTQLEQDEELDDIKRVLEAEAAREETEYEDPEDRMVREIAAQGPQTNISLFAFTATPKKRTFEVFGRIGVDNKPHAFHLYTMKQAIEEGFILDVLKNYVTYDTYFKLGKSISDDPKYDSVRANKALGRYMRLHNHVIAQKSEIIIEHFRSNVQQQLKGQAKAMVVTSSRLAAVLYYLEFRHYIDKMGYSDLGVLVAFSGTVVDEGGNEYSESGMNGFSETATREEFKKVENRVMLVANKFQTGFDEPRLVAMYVDKILTGIAAVQTLSRLNRIYPGKTETFILDFVNDRDTIQAAFKDYYDVTEIDQPTDINDIYMLERELGEFNIYSDIEVENFGKVLYGKPTKDLAAKIEVILNPVVDRYLTLEDEKRVAFKDKIKRFVRFYSFITQVMRFGDIDLHKFNAFCELLSKKLPTKGIEPLRIDDEVNLEFFRTEVIEEGQIEIPDEGGELRGGGAGGGNYKEEEERPLSEIINDVNSRYDTEFTNEDKVLEQIIDDISRSGALDDVAKNNTFEDFFKPFYNALIESMIVRQGKNNEFSEMIMNNPEMIIEIARAMAPAVYRDLVAK